MSAVEYYSVDTRWGARGGSVTMHDRLTRSRETSQPAARFGRISGMIETAENLARDYGISRQEADRYALGSQQRATAARERGAFADEIVALTVASRRGPPVQFVADEGIRPNTTLESLGMLKPILPAAPSPRETQANRTTPLRRAGWSAKTNCPSSVSSRSPTSRAGHSRVANLPGWKLDPFRRWRN